MKAKTLIYKDNKVPAAPQEELLASHHPLLDEFLEGGIRWGEISEWGIPWGQALREVVLPFLVSAQKNQTPKPWILWIYGQKDVCINPLAWHARGLDLSHMRFAHTQQPVHELKPIFLSPFFRIIVIDSVRNLSDEECAFLARQARRQQQLLFLIRPFLLSPQQGNVWAKTRINCWRSNEQQRIYAKIVKGRSPRQVTWLETALYQW